MSSNAVASPNDTRTRETLHLRGGGNGNGGTTREEVRPTNIRMAQAATTTIAPTPAGGTLAPSPWVLDATLTSSVVPTVIHPVVGDAMNTDTLFPTPQLTTIAPTLALVQRGPVVSPRAPHQTIVLAPPTLAPATLAKPSSSSSSSSSSQEHSPRPPPEKSTPHPTKSPPKSSSSSSSSSFSQCVGPDQACQSSTQCCPTTKKTTTTTTTRFLTCQWSKCLLCLPVQSKCGFDENCCSLNCQKGVCVQ